MKAQRKHFEVLVRAAGGGCTGSAVRKLNLIKCSTVVDDWPGYLCTSSAIRKFDPSIKSNISKSQ